MADAPDHIILEYLRRIRATVERTADDVRDVKQRMTSIEYQVAQLQIAIGHVRGDVAGQAGRLDRIEARLERIEARLDLVDPAVSPGL